MIFLCHFLKRYLQQALEIIALQRKTPIGATVTFKLANEELCTESERNKL